MAGIDCHLQKYEDRDDEADENRDQADENGNRAAPAGQLVPYGGLETGAGRIALGKAALGALEKREDKGDNQQAEGQLGGRKPVAHGKPGAVDAGREGLDAEMGHGAEVGNRFHQRKDHAAGNGRARHRQADTEEGAPGTVSERAGREIGRR